MTKKKRTVEIGQICWLTGGYDAGLSGRLVRVVSIKDKKNCRGIGVVLVNRREDDFYLKKDEQIFISSADWLFIYPEEYHPFCEGTPESISQPKPTKTDKCSNCGSKVTKKMKFCGECGVAISSRF